MLQQTGRNDRVGDLALDWRDDEEIEDYGVMTEQDFLYWVKARKASAAVVWVAEKAIAEWKAGQ
jgi:type IV secretory pathway TraG/TraD family ATPase VirD4